MPSPASGASAGAASSCSSSPFPPPALAASARRRRRRLLPSPNYPSPASGASTWSTSTSSSSFSSSMSFPFPSFSPSPSPFHHRFLSPLRSSAVPFSWEHRPGIPKTPARQKQPHRGGKPSKPPPLPLPPSLLSNKVVAADPGFSDADDYLIFPGDTKKMARRTRRRRRRLLLRQQQQQQRPRRPALAAILTDWLAVLSLYRSCTRSHDCLAATGPLPRPRPSSPAAKAGLDTINSVCLAD
ncbi:hypothetical protein GUJ93_ZPchr0014g46911 [Zizania palustris]|uniref:Uncharacterized protein n=1 Tax=Zizania palustris TaxID=103762 RepID=A0A8J5SVG2_ZIZPA|nr:hypothetical protein GUJ93_ZPchr0014g46911 [Zizania palustris]